MRPPPPKPFAIAFLVCLGLFIVWAIVGSLLEPILTKPDVQESIKGFALIISFGLFLIMAFSAVPVMVHLFFKYFLKMQESAGNLERPFVRKIKDHRETIVTILIYSFWALYALGMIIALPFAFRDLMNV